MVLALAGDSTITSLVQCPFPAAPFVALPLSPLFPLFEAAAVFPAALLFPGTLFPTSHQKRHGPSSRCGGASASLDATPPSVPYAARPRNARPCRYPCNPVRRPDCSRAAFRACPHHAEDAGSSPTRLALFHGVRTIRSNGRV